MTASTPEGHTFLVHGRIESFVHDVAVIPTDSAFHVQPGWRSILAAPTAKARPFTWPAQYAQSAHSPDVWFIDVGDVLSSGLGVLAKRVTELLVAIADSRAGTESRGPVLRVAMPILGIAGGGMTAQKGEVIVTLLATLQEAVTRLGIDVILVTPERTVFAAAQHKRRETGAWPLSQSLIDTAESLGKLAVDNHLAVFIGAGVSVAAGLPGWDNLLGQLSQRGPGALADFEDLPALDQAQLLEKRLQGKLGTEVAAIIKEVTRPSLAHVLLAGLQCNEVITTNYDRLYEAAVSATGNHVDSVLPWNTTSPRSPWILKMHGDVEHEDSIVLTRRHFVKYDAATRPAGSLLQSLLMTRHLLVVGASLNDDNVARLTLEVDQFRSDSGVTEAFGSFVDVSASHTRRELWSDQLTWIDCTGASLEERVRTMEVFLDVVSAKASNDASWLLDQRFEGMLENDARVIARTARELLVEAKGSGLRSVQPLVEALQGLGAQ